MSLAYSSAPDLQQCTWLAAVHLWSRRHHLTDITVASQALCNRIGGLQNLPPSVRSWAGGTRRLKASCPSEPESFRAA